MSRFAWLLGAVGLVGIGLLVACGTSYNAAADGLVVLGSQGSGLLETFSFDLNSGSVTAITNTPTDTSNLVCVLNGVPTSVVLDAAGAYAYTIINANSSCNTTANPNQSITGILAFKVNSDGTVTQAGSLVTFNPEIVTIQGTNTQENVPVVPSMMVTDSAGKYLFVADRSTTDSSQFSVPGAVSVFAINNGTATEVAGSPFLTAINPVTTTTNQNLVDIISVAVTPTVFPSLNAVCSLQAPPTAEYLYAADHLGNQVWDFPVDTSTGALGLPLAEPADQNPAGVAVDPCNRFVYVSNYLSAKISAYTMCNGSQTQSAHNCPPAPDGSLVPVSGSPFSLPASALGPGPLVVDPYGNTIYVLDTSNQISILRISPISGSVSSPTQATVTTGSMPTSIAIRSDDSWLFVTNFNSATLSQYSITPESGTLGEAPTIQTDNYPWGVAVK